ncbi:MAG: imidazole glycerol phosphate synthase subunit HisF [Patescibacteria group bacterium]
MFEQKTASNLTKRIIPCLDIKNGRVVKGTRFESLRDAGDPVSLGKKYSEEGADELVFLDIAASKENRGTMMDLVKKVAREVFIPFTVGGGIRNVEEIRVLLQAGADKISLNTAAILNPNLISAASEKFGAQCIVVGIDVKKIGEEYRVFIKGGSEPTTWNALKWAKEAEKLGAGEILLTSMDSDGTQQGFDILLLKKISSAVKIPVIASGGAGSLEDFKEACVQGQADAVLAASLFHYGSVSIKEVKNYLNSLNIPVRI